VAKKTDLSELETQIFADFATAVHAETGITLAAADEFFVIDNGTTPDKVTAAAIATFVEAAMWTDPTDAASVVTTDTILIKHSGTVYEATVDQLATFVTTGAQASILNVSGLAALTSATLTTDDYLLICQSTTAKQTTMAEVIDFVLDGLPVYIEGNGDDIAALPSITTLTGAEIVYCLQSSTAMQATVSQIAEYAVEQAADLPWEEIAAAKYTATPTSTSTLAMSDTSGVAVGRPVKYTYNGTAYYGIITALSANASITVAGAPLNLSYDLTALHVGLPSMVHQEEFFIDTAYGDAVQDIFSAVTYQRFKWQKAAARLVSFSATNGVADTGAAQPKINVKVGGNLVSTADTNKGV
jgi:hypothetical protein